MCGITGFIDLSQPSLSRSYLDRMTDILKHRGPDGRGTYTDGPVGLGHRRLSIIDLEGGKQPLSNEDGTIWITFNGEIYNFQHIKKNLEKKGHRFKTKSDTETIIHAYEEYGTDCLQYLRGMFAFGIWDAKKKQLFLARDRVGKKPLYYYQKNSKLVFASEIKSILQDKTIERQIDFNALVDFFTYNYVPFPKTIFQNIHKLPPGHFLLAQQEENTDGTQRLRITVQRYWDLHFRPNYSLSEQDWLEGLREKLLEAVKLRMLSDVPLGAFLSGGVDSSSIVAFMASLDTSPIKTFSIGFDEDAFNELGFARIVANNFKTDHHEFTVKPNAIETLEKLSWVFDEPFGDSSAIPTYYVSKMARQYVTVVLSGDGGDEAFAGYDRYKTALAFMKADFIPISLRRIIFGGLSAVLPMGTRGKGLLYNLSRPRFERSAGLRTFDGSGYLVKLLSHDVLNAAGVSKRSARQYSFLKKFYNRNPELDYLSKLQYEDFKTYLAEDIMTKVDRASMFRSLETRAPLLDHVLLEFIATIPSSLKIHQGEKKYIFKKCLEPLLPNEILYRSKKGFNVPLNDWFKNDLKEFTYDVLTCNTFKKRGFFNPDFVKSLLNLHQHRAIDLSDKIWSILFFEKWCQNWLDT